MGADLPVYRVRDWNKHFENHDSRKVKSLAWVPVKNKHDGAGYRRVAALPNSVQVFCGWCLIIQVASRMPTRGVLRDDDGALHPADLAAKTGYPETVFKAAFDALTDPKIRWLELESPGESPGNDSNSGNFRDAPGDSGAEGKGREGNKKESACEASDWAERIRTSYPSTTCHSDAFNAIMASFNKGYDPELILEKTKECASIILAAEKAAGGPIRWVPSPKTFFTDEVWKEPLRLAENLKPKFNQNSKPSNRIPTGV